MGSIGHLGSELFKLKAGNLISLHVPYKGNSPAPFRPHCRARSTGCSTRSARHCGHYKAGKLRYLAVCAEKRTVIVPELPTTGEGGLPDVLISTVNPVALPAGAPADVVNTDRRRHAAGSWPTRRCRPICAPSSIEPIADADPVKSAAYFSAERERWGPIIKASGAKME